MEIRKYLEIIWRRKWVFIQAVGIVVLFTLVSIILVNPIYKTSTLVRIDVQDLSVRFLSPGEGGATGPWLPTNLGKATSTTSENLIGTFQAMIENKENVSGVIRELNLKQQKKDEFIEVKDFINPSLVDLIRQAKGVGISQIPNTDIYEITGYSESTDEAVNIANKVAGAFFEFLKDINRQKVLQTYNWLKREAPKIEKDLAKAEKNLEDFRKENQVISLDDQEKTLIDQKSGLESELYRTQRSLIEQKSSLLLVKKTLSKQPDTRISTKTIEDNPLLVNYKNSLLTLEVSLAKALGDMSPEHPLVKEIQIQIERVRREISSETTKTFASEVAAFDPHFDSLVEKHIDIEIHLVSLKANEVVLSKQIEVLVEKLNEIPSKELKLLQYTRKVNALLGTYNTLLGQLEMARIAKDMDIANATIVEVATIPAKNPKKYVYFPKKLTMGVLSLFLGGGFGLFLVFFLEYMDHTIRTATDVSEILEHRALGIIPKLSKKALNIRSQDNASLINSFYNLRSNMKLTTLGQMPKILSVVSTAKGEGKSTIVALLGYVLAKGNLKILLVDLNFHQPALHKIFGLVAIAGLGKLLISQIELDKVVHSTNIPGLDLITNNSSILNPLEMLESPKLAEVIEILKTMYDVIIMDTPAMEVASDARVISAHSDQVLFVVGSGKTSRHRIRDNMQSLKEAKINILRIILNKYRPIRFLPE